MTANDWVLLKNVYSQAESEIIKGMLEAQEIEVLLAQEGAAKAIGLNVGSLGEIQIHVQSSDIDDAKSLVADFYSGDIEENEG